ncbi:MAG: family 2 glycosyl transferase [Ponticaulis sp.]|nr:family 2 glycosyl transferase [Ponticaulis sp.]|tara:strand:+ start:7407 stop:8909 length:1503 start_codon:yes stop_codon:yes gene_type:complete
MADDRLSSPQGLARWAAQFAALSDRICVPDDAEGRRVFAETDKLVFRPEQSCTLGVTAAQRQIVKKTGILFGSIGAIEPGLLILMLTLFGFSVFAVLILFRMVVILAGLIRRLGLAGRAHPADAPAGMIWPVYTVLVPVYREPIAVSSLIAALKGLDYPKKRLDIQILIEEEDTETLEALLAEKLKPHFRIVPVPKGYLRTKPRALNYGLTLAEGQLVTIYDAEDQMHSGQLKAAAMALQRPGAERMACVQAPLVPHNGSESWIARQFELEYLTHFGLFLPGLSTLSLPIMLGGTSNHFRKEVLDEVGAWDPYNMTEDADLGLRIARYGYQIGMISNPTYEEAPVGLSQWLGQRSRWVKGFIQTLGVFTRHPAKAIQSMGVRNWVAALLLLGGAVLSAILHGPLAIWLILCALWPGLSPPQEGLMLLATGFSLHLVSSVLSWDRFSFVRLFAAVTAPVYWPLQSLAAIRAIQELMRNPYFWNKTEHGLTRQTLNRSRLRN